MQFAAFRHFLVLLCVCSCTVNAMQLNVTENMPLMFLHVYQECCLPCGHFPISTVCILVIQIFDKLLKNVIGGILNWWFWIPYTTKFLSGKAFAFRLEETFVVMYF